VEANQIDIFVSHSAKAVRDRSGAPSGAQYIERGSVFEIRKT
jgi:hypothetical protein